MVSSKNPVLKFCQWFFLKLVGPEREREPSEEEVRAAVWEACGDSGAFQLLVDLLNTR